MGENKQRSVTELFLRLCEHVQSKVKARSTEPENPRERLRSKSREEARLSKDANEEELVPWGWIAGQVVRALEAYESGLSMPALLQQVQRAWDDQAESRLTLRVSLSQVYHTHRLSKASVLDLVVSRVEPDVRLDDFPVYNLLLLDSSRRRKHRPPEALPEAEYPVWAPAVGKLAHLIRSLWGSSSSPTLVSTTTSLTLSSPLSSSPAVASSSGFPRGARLRMTGCQLQGSRGGGELCLLATPFVAIVVDRYAQLLHRQKALGSTHAVSLSQGCASGPGGQRVRYVEMVEMFQSAKNFYLAFVGDFRTPAARLFQPGDILAIENPAYVPQVSAKKTAADTFERRTFLQRNSTSTSTAVDRAANATTNSADDDLKIDNDIAALLNDNDADAAFLEDADAVATMFDDEEETTVDAEDAERAVILEYDPETTLLWVLQRQADDSAAFAPAGCSSQGVSSPVKLSSCTPSPASPMQQHRHHPQSFAVVDCCQVRDPLTVWALSPSMINVPLLARVTRLDGNHPLPRTAIADTPTARYRLCVTSPHCFSAPLSQPSQPQGMLSLSVFGELGPRVAALRVGQTVFIEGLSTHDTISLRARSPSPSRLRASVESTRESSVRSLDSVRGLLAILAASHGLQHASPPPLLDNFPLLATVSALQKLPGQLPILHTHRACHRPPIPSPVPGSMRCSFCRVHCTPADLLPSFNLLFNLSHGSLVIPATTLPAPALVLLNLPPRSYTHLPPEQQLAALQRAVSPSPFWLILSRTSHPLHFLITAASSPPPR